LQQRTCKQGHWVLQSRNASVGKKLGDKFSMIVSGNFQNRNRVDSEYYNEGMGSYLPLEQFITDPATRSKQYPDPTQSVK
jgi:hypothetical protein